MGASVSEPSDAPDQIFVSANKSRKRNWQKSTDIFDVRVSTSHIEEAFANTYYDQYLVQCAAKRDVSEFYPNEEFQMAVDTLEENPAAHAAELEAVAQKHLHDVMDIVTSIVDDYDADSFTPVFVAPGVGKAYVHHGFFFFVWGSYVGEKFGRLELRNSRRLMELQMMSVHVPLTYHLVYRGRGVTVQSLTPIDSRSTRMEITSSVELQALAHEICASLGLGPYEDDRVPYFLSNQVEAHQGKDGRIYFIRNSYWSPPWLSCRGARVSPEQRFSCVRTELLVRKGGAICCRAFQKDALATENTSAATVMRKLLDKELHDVPKILGTLADTSNVSILVRFRDLGFNWSMLGLLLLSLFRNVSPPVTAVRAVLTEMFVRGIKQFIMWKAQPEVLRFDDSHRNNAGGSPARNPSVAPSKEVDDPYMDPDSVPFDDANFGSSSTSSFIDDVHLVLRSFLEYQGAPQPRPATILSRAIPPPPGIFGSEVIPHIYKKFRLLPEDVDLYGKFNDEMKWDVYQRVTTLLGVKVVDGKVARVLPVVLQPSAPRTFLSNWILRRTEGLVRQLLQKQASRANWLRNGPALIPLLRLQPQNLSFYHHLESVLTALQQPMALICHIQQHCFQLHALQAVIAYRELNVQSPASRHTLIQLYRKRAFACYDAGDSAEAVATCDLAVEQGKKLLEQFGNHFSVQFRRLVSELTFYSSATDLSNELNMLRLISRYCEPDILTADDFLQLAVTRARSKGTMTSVDEAEMEWDLTRAIRIYADKLGESHPKTLRAMANLAILWLETDRQDDAKIVLRTMAAEEPHCPSDVREIVQRLTQQQVHQAGVPQTSAPQPAEEKEHPFMFVFHQPKFVV